VRPRNKNHTLASWACRWMVGDRAWTEADGAHEVWGATEDEPVPLLCVVIDASGILGADASGLRVLRSIIDEHHKRSPPVEMMLASTKGPLRMSLRKAGEHLAGLIRTPSTPSRIRGVYGVCVE
jgi:hypothetical protein